MILNNIYGIMSNIRYLLCFQNGQGYQKTSIKKGGVFCHVIYTMKVCFSDWQPCCLLDCSRNFRKIVKAEIVASKNGFKYLQKYSVL